MSVLKYVDITYTHTNILMDTWVEPKYPCNIGSYLSRELQSAMVAMAPTCSSSLAKWLGKVPIVEAPIPDQYSIGNLQSTGTSIGLGPNLNYVGT